MRAAILLITATLLPAQTFELASVNVNTSGDGSASYPRRQEGHMRATNATMRMILQTPGLIPIATISTPNLPPELPITKSNPCSRRS
ncbi:MAG TPA: hypothetical protein VN519_02495 [Bryobacteraceae bacterium]|nr:hypothetical protein [Bryobacteraceae bacterium]